jgi:hypothetical protein
MNHLPFLHYLGEASDSSSMRISATGPDDKLLRRDGLGLHAIVQRFGLIRRVLTKPNSV